MDKGEIFGFLGPNGAGKTTTVKLLCGMLTPSGGKCQVLGIDPVQNPEQLHQKVGVVTEHAQNVNSLIQEQAAEGVTVFLCTHQLRYEQEICTTYGLMDKGHLFAAGNITELRAMVSRNRRVRVKASCLPKGMVYKEVGDHIYDVDVASEHDIPLIVKRIVEAYGGEYLVRTDAVESWNERRKPDRCIVIRFPNREAIENCFASEQYKKIMSKRTEHVDSRAIIVPGMDIKCDPDMTNMII
ncbi:DUF1330 domain-containing protein [Eubacterium ramulus]